MKPTRIAIHSLLLTAGLVAESQAGSASFDFNTDPTGLLNLSGSAVWRETGGVGNTGYLSITDALGGQSSVIVFDDFDSGAVVNSFLFSCDLRTGGGTDSPADGYSVSFARENDPVVETGTGFAGINTETNLPEEGTTTGVSVGLDEWNSGGTDVIGLSVRVDGVLVNQTPMPTQNGAATDTTSLQTGPANRPLDPDNSVPDHTFVNLTIQMDPDGTLDVTYKGRKILDNLATSYFPSRGRLVFAGRTGGSNAHHHVDNIVITTTAATLPTLTGLTIAPFKLTASVTDSAASVLDATKPVTVTVDGTPVTATVSKTGADTTITVLKTPPAYFAQTNHEVVIDARDVNNNPISFTRTVAPAAFTLVDPAWKAVAGTVSTATRGFRARVHQIGFGRFPGDANILPNPERQNANGYFDVLTGTVAENLAAAGPDAGGSYIVENGMDWDQDGGNGHFGGVGIPGIPGSTGSTDNITGELYAWLDLPAGTTRLGVNSDDGFTVSFGATPLDNFGRTVAGVFDGGRGATDTLFDIAVPVAGLYPVRLLWWEGGGGANCEFFSVKSDGTQVLIDDPTDPDAIKAYYVGQTAASALHNVAPYPGTTENDPRHPILLELVDGVLAVNDSTITMSVNGTPVTPVVANPGPQVTTVTYSPPGGFWPSGSVNNVSLTWSDSAGTPRTQVWTFTVAKFVSLTTADACTGTPSNPGYSARIYQVASRDAEPSGVGTENWNEVTDDILAGLYGENVADLGTADPDGIFRFTETLNWDQDGGIGNFLGDTPIPGIPGTTGSTDNIAAEVLTYLEFPAAGVYTMGVNSDDGFRVTLGHDGPSRHLVELTGGTTINGPVGSISGTTAFGSIGAPLTGVVEGAVVVADPLIGDTALNNAAAVAGKICYIDRGTVTFATKILNAQAAGAIGVIIGNSNGGYPSIMGGDPAGITIPAVMIQRDDGTAIKAAITAGEPLRASFGFDANPRFGEFSGGRGSSDTTFLVDVKNPGVYPVRLTWKEGGGGANCEWFTLKSDGSRVLVNDPLEAESIKAWQTCGDDLAIADVAVNRTAGTFDLTWNSSPGGAYAIEYSETLTGVWSEITDNFPAGAGATTSYHGDIAVNPLLPDVRVKTRLFFRIRAVQ